jgi:uncharacterized membrane protein
VGAGVTANVLNKQIVVAGMEIGLAVNGAKKEVLSMIYLLTAIGLTPGGSSTVALWLVTRLQHRISVAKSVETVAKCVYLGIRTQNCTHEESKNTCRHWAQNLMS